MEPLVTHSMKERSDWQWQELTKKVMEKIFCIREVGANRWSSTGLMTHVAKITHFVFNFEKKTIKKDVMANKTRKDSHRRILSKAECSASTAAVWCSASLHIGLGSISLDAQPYARAVSCQIKPQETY